MKMRDQDVFDPEAGKLTLSDHADSVGLQFVSQDLLPLLGIKPQLGRNFQSDDVPFNGSQTIILSYGFWQRRFGADPGGTAGVRSRSHRAWHAFYRSHGRWSGDPGIEPARTQIRNAAVQGLGHGHRFPPRRC